MDASRTKLFILLKVIFSLLSISCTGISTQTYNLQTPMFDEQSVIKLVLISDLHNTRHGVNQEKLINLIKEAEPDLILLTGDIIDEVSSIKGTRMLLSGISGIAPVYYVTGNHEYMTKKIESIRKELISFGVIILSDTYVRLEINKNNVILAGIEDPYKKKYEAPDYIQEEIIEVRFRELDEIHVYKILLAHRPELIETYKKYSFNLVLSGHTHGGQVIIPNSINGLYAPHQGLFPKYGGGLYAHDELTHIVSRGLSINFFLPRIFNPPELVVIMIEGE
jgi:predicted MPP superfamily phosphohydrolase